MTMTDSGPADPAAIKVRPFNEAFAQPGRAPTELTGYVDGATFMVRTMGTEVALATRETGVDETGPFAIVTEGDYTLAGRIALRVQPEYEPDMPHGGEISVELPADPDAIRRALFDTGIDPNSVNVVAPIQRGFGVYFDLDGRLDGRTEVNAPPPKH